MWKTFSVKKKFLNIAIFNMGSNEILEAKVIQLQMEVKASYMIINKLRNENKILEEYEEAIIEFLV